MNTNKLAAAMTAAFAMTAAAIPAFAQDRTVIESKPSFEGTTTTVRSPQTTTRVSTSGYGSVVTVTVNDEKVSFAESSQPRMMSGRVMIPLRGVIERLGGNVLYEPKTKVINVAHAQTGNQIRMRVGSNDVLLNGEQMNLDVQPQVIAGTTYVPLRFVSEALGADVAYNDDTNTVSISAAGNTARVKAG